MSDTLSHLIADIEARRRQLEAQKERFDPVSSFSISAQNERIEKARRDELFFAREYMPEIFDKPFGAVHQEWLAIFNRREHELHNIQGPRFHGKSSLLRAVRMHHMLFKRFRSALRIGERLEDAQAEIEATMVEFELNMRILHDFGDVASDKWSTKFIRLKNGVTLQAGSVNVKARGILPRPDWVEIDDFEDQESAANPDRGRKKLEWLINELYLACSKDSNITWLSNNLSLDSAANQYKNILEETPRPKLHCHVYEALLSNGKLFIALWPEAWTPEELLLLRETVGFAAFEAEMQQNPVRPGEKFKPEWISTVELSEIEKSKTSRRVGMFLDPSYGTSDAACYKAWIVMATDGRYFDILDCWVRQASVLAMFHAGFDLYRKWSGWNITVCRWETTLSNILLKADYFAVAKERGEKMPLGDHVDTTNKDIRIESLSMPIETGVLRFVTQGGQMSQDMKRLVEQFTSYPRGPKDGPDATAMLYQLMLRSVRASSEPVYKSLAKRLHRWRH